MVGWRQAKAKELRITATMAFLIAAIVIFLVGYLVKLAPWEWDNIKIIVWAYIIILPFLWTELVRHWPVLLRTVICITLFWSGSVTLLGGLAAGKTGFGITDRGLLDAVGVAVNKLPTDARYAGWPFWGHPILLQGRKMVLGYPGHLWTQGFDYGPINDKLNALMNGAPDWKEIARTLNARYLFWGRDEKTNFAASRKPWERESVAVATGESFTIYDLQSTRPQQPPPQPPVPTLTPGH